MFGAPSFYISSIFSLKMRAIAFFILLCGLTACDDKSSKITSNSDSSRVEIKSTHSRELLLRGSYQDLVLTASEVKSLNQMAILFDLYEGLTSYDAKGNLQPAAAESWQSEDHKTWFIILREGLQWSNGEPINAEDFVYSWRQLVKEESSLKSYLAFMHIENAELVLEKKLPVENLGIEAVDERILRIQLDKPTPYLPAMLAHIALLPKYPRTTENWVSNGAYQLEQWNGDKAILSKNPFYWQKDRVAFKTVEYKKITSEQSSEVDFIWQAQKQVTDYFPQLCSYYYEFNLAHPQLSNKAVRKALSSMISSANLVKNNPQMTALNQLLPPSLQNASEPVWENVVPEQLFEQNGINENNPLALTLTYDQKQPYQQISEQLIRIWGQLDLLRLRSEPLLYQQLLERRANKKFDIIRAGWCADYQDPTAFLNQFHSKNVDNKISYQNPEFDQLLEQALQEQDPKQRQMIYAKLEQILQQDYVIIPIFQYQTPVFVNSTLAGFHQKNASDVVYSKDLYRKVKTD